MASLQKHTNLGKLLVDTLVSNSLWKGLLLGLVFFHVFTWSFPYPSNTEAEKYLQGLRGEAPEAGWIILTRIVEMTLSFGYAKFFFVALGLVCVLLVYQTFKILANKKLATVGALIFGLNSCLFTFMHRTQPEVVIALLFLASIYLYVRFATLWHIDLDKSAHLTTSSIAVLAFCMLNTDFYSIYLIPPLALLILFVQMRIYSLIRAIVSTIMMACAFMAVQWLIAPQTYFQFFEIAQENSHLKKDLTYFESLNLVYADGYTSSAWYSLYKGLDFLKFEEAFHGSREFLSLLIVSSILVILFLIKIMRLLSSRRWSRTDFMVMVYRPHIPLILTLCLAIFTTAASHVVVREVTPPHIFVLVFLLILLCFSIYAFFLKLIPAERQIVSVPRWSELVYKPVGVAALIITLVIGFANAVFYVAPFRGSNYPAVHDVLQRRWEGAECTRIAYAPTLYVVTLAGKQRPIPRSIEDLYEVMRAGKPLEEGCIILSLIAKDGVHSYAQAAEKMNESIVDLLSSAHYSQIDRIVLPFYQKDPLFPITAIESSNPYEHAHGVPLYGFGGMEEIIIYRKF